MDFAYSRPFLYTVISSFRKDTVIFLYKEEKWRKYKIMSNIRIFDIPDECNKKDRQRSVQPYHIYRQLRLYVLYAV